MRKALPNCRKTAEKKEIYVYTSTSIWKISLFFHHMNIKIQSRNYHITIFSQCIPNFIFVHICYFSPVGSTVVCVLVQKCDCMFCICLQILKWCKLRHETVCCCFCSLVIFSRKSIEFLVQWSTSAKIKHQHKLFDPIHMNEDHHF